MRRLVSAAVMLLVFVLPFFPFSPTSAQGTVSCTNYDAWEWAQSVFESDPDKYDALDPDGDGIACPELPKGGFAPAFWTEKMPDGLEEVTIIKIVDGDTLEVLIDGVSNRVRIYRADTPETQNEQHCGGSEATAFADWALSFNDEPGTVYLERDKNTRDRYGRELAYVWFLIDGKPYMLNHILINNGWAEDVDYGDRKYDTQFKEAAAFSERHELGVYNLCGDWGLPVAVPPTAAPPPTQVPQVPAPPPAPAPQPAPGCDPNYTPCIPAYPPDLDCGQIGITVQVIGGDPHGLDRDKDGWGCE
jgi:micrococcal nuclease